MAQQLILIPGIQILMVIKFIYVVRLRVSFGIDSCDIILAAWASRYAAGLITHIMVLVAAGADVCQCTVYVLYV